MSTGRLPNLSEVSVAWRAGRWLANIPKVQ
jgi:hypothetical protein